MPPAGGPTELVRWMGQVLEHWQWCNPNGGEPRGLLAHPFWMNGDALSREAKMPESIKLRCSTSRRDRLQLPETK